jgi:hypothetical protein
MVATAKKKTQLSARESSSCPKMERQASTHPEDWHIDTKHVIETSRPKRMRIYVSWTDCHAYNFSTSWTDRK